MIKLFIEKKHNWNNINSTIIPHNFQLGILNSLLKEAPSKKYINSLKTVGSYNIIHSYLYQNNIYISYDDIIFENLNNAYGEHAELIITNTNYKNIIHQWENVLTHKYPYVIIQKEDDGWINLIGKYELSKEDLTYLEQEKKDAIQYELDYNKKK